MDVATFVEMCRAVRAKVFNIPDIDPALPTADVPEFLRSEAERFWNEESQRRNISTRTEIEVCLFNPYNRDKYVISFVDPDLKVQIAFGLENAFWNRRNDHG